MNFSPEKLFLVGLIALMVFGPNRLPHMARSAGKTLAEFRRMSGELQSQVTHAMSDPAGALTSSVGLPDARTAVADVASSMRRAMDDVVNPPPVADAAGEAVLAGRAGLLPGPVVAGQPDDPSFN
jgi:sec-independent protein translocase protein TatA